MDSLIIKYEFKNNIESRIGKGKTMNKEEKKIQEVNEKVESKMEKEKITQWPGFKYEADENGDCFQFLNYVKNFVCDGDKNLFKYVMDWLAQLVQEPEKILCQDMIFCGKDKVARKVIVDVIAELF